jgi:hypothetical protein
LIAGSAMLPGTIVLVIAVGGGGRMMFALLG